MVTIIVVEDCEAQRRRLEGVFKDEPGIAGVREFASGESALEGLGDPVNRIFLVDIELRGGMSGVEFLRRLRRRDPEALTLMLTVYQSVEVIFGALEAGAHGYLLKSASDEEIRAAVRELARGGAPMTPSIARKVIQRFHRDPHDGAPSELAELSRREWEILEQLSRGRSDKEIGAELNVAPSTVSAHLRNIYRKLHVGGRKEARAKFLAN